MFDCSTSYLFEIICFFTIIMSLLWIVKKVVTCYSVLNLCVLFGLWFLRNNWLVIKHFTSCFQVHKWKSTVVVFINTDKLSKYFSAVQFLS